MTRLGICNGIQQTTFFKKRDDNITNYRKNVELNSIPIHILQMNSNKTWSY
jgi:hypothetical protein